MARGGNVSVYRQYESGIARDNPATPNKGHNRYTSEHYHPFALKHVFLEIFGTHPTHLRSPHPGNNTYGGGLGYCMKRNCSNSQWNIQTSRFKFYVRLDHYTLLPNTVLPMILRYIPLYPTGWRRHGRIALRGRIRGWRHYVQLPSNCNILIVQSSVCGISVSGKEAST